MLQRYLLLENVHHPNLNLQPLHCVLKVLTRSINCTDIHLQVLPPNHKAANGERHAEERKPSE